MARIFISYSHVDQGLRAQLDVHMALLRRQDHAEIWTDQCIRPGEPFDTAISAAMELADVILLLVSPEFMHSDYCVTIEMKRALERAKVGQSEVVPIILRPCDWRSSEIGHLKVLPSNGVPVVKFPTYDDGFHDVVTHLRTMLTAPVTRSPFPKHAANGSVPPASSVGDNGATASSQAAHVPVYRRSSNLNLPKQFSDLDRSEFVREGYNYILEYFTNSLKELEARNSHIQTRIRPETSSSFVATIFSNGKKVAGCGIRQGGFIGSNGINYVATDEPHSNSSNESLSLTDDKFNLGWRSMFGAAFSGRESSSPMTHEGAAGHLWDMFVKPLQHR